MVKLEAIRRRHVVRPAPDRDLVDAVLVDRLLLVEALERAVVPLVELPRLGDGDPHVVALLERVVERPDRLRARNVLPPPRRVLAADAPA